MLNGLSKDLSLEDPILPSNNSEARDLLMGKKLYMHNALL